MHWDHCEFKIAEHYLPALINWDTSGMTDEEEKEFDEWVESASASAGRPGWHVGHWSDVAGTGEDWGPCAVSGLLAMRCTVRLHIYKHGEGADE